MRTFTFFLSLPIFSCIETILAINMPTTTYSYGTNVLQTYDVYIPPASQDKDDFAPCGPKYWLVYIHGGYFRDFTVNSTSVEPSIAYLELSDPDLLSSRVAGIASLNYRLSALPGVQDPATTPVDELQRARWPDHLQDVKSGLKDLFSRFPMRSGFVLSGHSVGAQMAFLAALESLDDASIPRPVSVLGVSGIYDFRLIHETNPEYLNLTTNAMDEKYFDSASPAEYPGSEYGQLHLQAVVLAHSKDDGLVPWSQVDIMKAVVDSIPGLEGKSKVVELQGVHNAIWRDGKQLAKAFTEILNMLE